MLPNSSTIWSIATASSARSSWARVRNEGRPLTAPSGFDECLELTLVTEDGVRGGVLSDLGVSPEVVRDRERYSCTTLGGASLRIAAASWLMASSVVCCLVVGENGDGCSVVEVFSLGGFCDDCLLRYRSRTASACLSGCIFGFGQFRRVQSRSVTIGTRFR